MTVPEVPQSAPAQQPKRRSVFLTVLLVLIGIVLLLPGLCSLTFMVLMKGDGGGPVPALWLLTFGIAAGGIALIRYAIRNR